MRQAAHKMIYLNVTMLNIFIAVLLALIAPGAGQFYNGQYFKGLLFGTAFALMMNVLVPLVVRARGLTLKIDILIFVSRANAAYALIIFVSILDALFYALSIYKGYLDRPPHSLPAAAIFALAIVPMEKNLRNPVLIDMLAGLKDFAVYVTGKKRPENNAA